MSSKQQQTLGRFFGALKRPEDVKQQKIHTLIKKDSSGIEPNKKEDEDGKENFAKKSEDSDDEDVIRVKRRRVADEASEMSLMPSQEELSNDMKSQPDDDRESSLGKESQSEEYKDTDPSSDSQSELEKADVSKLIKMDTELPEIKKTSNNEILYSTLCEVYEELEKEPGRLKNLKITSDFIESLLLNDISKEELSEIVYLLINRLGPDYEGLELGLGETLLLKALAEATGRENKLIKLDFNKLGDIGLVAKQSRSKQPTMFKPKPLNVKTVFKNLTTIAKATGNNSQTRKINIIKGMVSATSPIESKFLLRSLEGKLRINFGEKSVLIALAQAFIQYEYKLKKKKLDPETITRAEETMKDAFSQIPNYAIIIETAMEYGVLNLGDHCTLKPGIPLKPMLAKPTKSITEILDRFHDVRFTCEYKYDGERCQLHLLPDGSIKIFSRNSEDMSQRYPDLIEVIENLKSMNKDLQSLILDCEAVAFDRELNKIMPFQILSTRKRKDVQAKDIKVRVCLFAFDMLCLNDEPLITKSLSDRREIMKKTLTTIEGEFQFAKAMDTSNTEEIQAFLDLSMKDACEGLMVKMLDGPDSLYEPSKRSRNWLKLKKDYLQGVGDSLDLVVVGAYIGKGKRTGWYGGFLLLSYNLDTGEYETTCKIGTGFSEEVLASLTEKLKPTEIANPKASYIYDTNNSNAVPDVWFEPTTVFEVLTADLSLSPIYKAGANEYGKGISLRFPRFIRIREDKSVEDATTSEQIVEFYQRQANVQ